MLLESAVAVMVPPPHDPVRRATTRAPRNVSVKATPVSATALAAGSPGMG